MIIRRNTSALRAYNAGRKTVSALSKNLEKLSSGYQINRAADDAAGLCASEKMRAKITELGRCQHNASEGIDLARTADAALQEVNDMLKRARSLCIQAENGTYSDQELAAISDEMNHLFGEIDRISAGSYHNSICLFRGDIGQTYHDEYDEHFYPLGPDELELWGEMDSVVTADFDPAERATPATATFKLGDSIDFDDVNSLNGKSITIGNQTFHFTRNSAPSGTTAIYISNSSTVKGLLESLTRSADVSAVTVDKDARTVTLTAALKPLSEVIQADGKTLTSVAKDGNGEAVNGNVVNNPMGDKSIAQMDGSGASNNEIQRSNVFTGYFNVGSANLTQDNVDNLKENTLHVYNKSITFTTGSASGNQVAISAGMTRKQLGDAIAAVLNSDSKYKAECVVNSSGYRLNVTYTSDSTLSSSSMRIYESTKTLDSTSSQNGQSWTASALNVSVTPKSASMESGGSCAVKLPNIQTNTPFAVYINGRTHLYYNSDNSKLTYDEFTETRYGSYSGSLVRHDMKGKTADQIRAEIVSNIKSYANGAYPGIAVSESGDTLTFSSSTPGQDVTLSMIRGESVTVTPYKPGSATTTSHVMNSSTYYFQQPCSVQFSLGSGTLNDAAKEALAGKGFSLEPYYNSSYYTKRVEFTNGGSGLHSSYTDIDLATCSTFDEVAEKVQDALRGSSPAYTVSIDTTDPANAKLNIAWTRSVIEDSPTIIDGNEGITDGTPVQFEGGTNTNHSQKAIDFSEINEDNLDTLLGKGFRINCATCSGEYINVFFCWTNDGSVPLAFEKKDPVTGEMRAIHNIPVELSKVTSGDKIVQSIVEQVRPSLNHYTDVAVGDPPTTLIAMEKRIGDVRDNAGNLYLGSVETGVEANFRYYVEKKKVLDLPEGDLDELKTAEVNIYVGSDPEPQLIPVHLPYIDLYHLRLRPPERVDLTAGGGQDPADWLGRVDRADVAISSARGTIGADYNRLEHALQDLSNADINLTDSESRIRDADMAELMKEQTKLQILMQSQQSMLAQANQVPQGVLQLLQ